MKYKYGSAHNKYKTQIPTFEQMLFAVVDIETTGGNAKNGKITEIAIVITDGENVVEKFESLVDPGMHIPAFITELTGITNQMVEDAPDFNQIAPQVHKLLNDKVFVAHNVNFDYSFVEKQLDEAGFTMPKKKLCTVRYGRKITPGHKSYSLGNICSRFGISNNAAHRAMGDTWATTLLLHELLLLDTNEFWKTYIHGINKEVNLPANLEASIFHTLPEQPGVYYLKNNTGDIIYIGKAKNIKSRIAQHFSGKKQSAKDQEFHRNIYTIEYQLTGTEFLALLYEDSEIRKYWPSQNKAQKSNPTKFHLSYYKDQNNLWRFGVIKGKYQGAKLLTTYSWLSAREILQDMVTNNQLIPELCQIALPDSNDISEETHNSNFQKLIDTYISNPVDFVIWEQGRTTNESAFILIKESQFYGFGFIPYDQKTLDLSILEQKMTLAISSGVTAKHISNYLHSSAELSIARIEYSPNNLLF